MRTALIALSVLALATGAQAKTAALDTQQLSIRYADLNLSSPAGQKRLETRIEVAVRDICDADYVPTGTRMSMIVSYQKMMFSTTVATSTTMASGPGCR